MKIILSLIYLTTFYLNAEILSKGINAIKYGSKTEDIKSISQFVRLSNISQKSLLYNAKAHNIQDLLSLAVQENKIRFVDQFKYRKEFQAIENGDKILLDALKGNKNLDDTLYQYSLTGQTISTAKILSSRVSNKVMGVVNDFKVYAVKNKNGKIIGNFKPTDFYNMDKIITMPSIIFIKGSKTSTGYLRNSSIYWKQYVQKFPQDLSKNNI